MKENIRDKHKQILWDFFDPLVKEQIIASANDDATMEHKLQIFFMMGVCNAIGVLIAKDLPADVVHAFEFMRQELVEEASQCKPRH